jgi:hypothetical protein
MKRYKKVGKKILGLPDLFGMSREIHGQKECYSGRHITVNVENLKKNIIFKL